MHRRALLTAIGTVTAGGFAGCVSDGPGSGGPPGESETATGGPGGESSPGSAVSLSDAELTVVDTGCGDTTDAAEVTVEESAETVVIAGTIWGSDGCTIPALADARYHADADELVVLVAVNRRDGSMGCADCISELDYEVTCAFDGDLPGTVTVRHTRGSDPATVTTATTN